MLDKSKVRLMARLAMYDKKYGAIDRKKNNFFKWDYIYFRNFWTRLGVFFGCMIITFFYVIHKLFIEQADVFDMNLKQEATKIGFYTLAVLVIYTVIGTLVSSNEYKKSRKRLDAYFLMLDMLDGRGIYAEEYDERLPEEDVRRDEPDEEHSFALGDEKDSDSDPFGWVRRRQSAPQSDAVYDEPNGGSLRYTLETPEKDGTFSRKDNGEEKGIEALKRFKEDKR